MNIKAENLKSKTKKKKVRIRFVEDKNIMAAPTALAGT